MISKDKILLRKRSVIETTNDQLKNTAQAEHYILRSFGNFITNLVARLIAYSFQEKKSSIRFETEKTAQLAFFFVKSLYRTQVEIKNVILFQIAH